MNFNIRPSGLAVPQAKPTLPPRRYGLLEIRDDEQRAKTREAMSCLWDAMDLSESSQFIMPDSSAGLHEARRDLFRYVGEALLGSDCPEKEIKT